MNVLKNPLLLFTALFIPFFLTAQTFRGRVSDADNGIALQGVRVELLLTNAPSSADNPVVVTDSTGQFRFSNLTPGPYRCLFSLKGYERRMLEEVSVAAGKEAQVEMSLRRSNTDLPELTITANEAGRRTKQPLSEVVLTREQTLRYPATFFDPARLALAAPGVAGTDDQANGMSVRGYSPAGLRWRIEGVDIVNPNHLAGAGTLSDLPAPASGGVLMFSAQLIDRSALLTGNFPMGYGDATGGIMDMYLRRGNSERREYTLQAGLIGIDLCAEGPFSPRKNASYVANYRYSTVGLLGQMGISFGNEKITFQDFSFNTAFSGKKSGQWTVFGMIGQSTNVFRHTEDRTQIAGYKELFDIAYAGKTAIGGFTHWMRIGQRAWIRTVCAGSIQENRRTVKPFFADFSQNAAENSTDRRWAGQTTIQHALNHQNRLRGGLNWSVRAFAGTNRWEEAIFYTNRVQWLPFLQPWAGWEWNSHQQKTSLKAGLHSHIALFNRRISLEPRLAATQRIGEKWQLAAAWGWHSEALPVWLYSALSLHDQPGTLPYRQLDLMRSTQSSLRAEYRPGGLWRYSAEVFWRQVRSVPVLAEVRNAFSLLNMVEGQFSDIPLSNEGRSRQYGLEAALERRFENGLFWNVNLTLLQADYTGSDGVWRPCRWSTRYISNISGGKEWDIRPRNGYARTFGCSTRFNWREGFWDTPVTTTKNPLNTRIQTTGEVTYSRRLRDFHRLDVRFYWKRHLADRRNSLLAFDLQNALNTRNIAYYYYDIFTKKPTTRLQLGLIPNISWKMEF